MFSFLTGLAYRGTGLVERASMPKQHTTYSDLFYSPVSNKTRGCSEGFWINHMRCLSKLFEIPLKEMLNEHGETGLYILKFPLLARQWKSGKVIAIWNCWMDGS